MEISKVKDEIISFIQRYFEFNGFKNAVIGVSGGIDSAVVLELAVEALGNENVYGLILPYKNVESENTKDARALCNKLKVYWYLIDITSQVESYFQNRKLVEDKKKLEIRIGNKCARERMSILYDYSAMLNALVLGTTNKSEMLTGYFTMGGDNIVAIEPIGNLYKTDVFELARYIGIDEKIVNKKPSADLWDGQTDESELGMNYERLDKALKYVFEESYSDKRREMLNNYFAWDTEQKENFEDIKKAIEIYNKTRFKRSMPLVCDLT
jgi:NAD+ synthase